MRQLIAIAAPSPAIRQSADAHCRLGYALYKAGRYAESRACFDAALALSPDLVEAQHNLGLLLLETGHADEALVRFERALASNPEIIETRACVAHALRDLGRLDEAIGRYDEVLAAQPQFADAVINRSYAIADEGGLCRRVGRIRAPVCGWGDGRARFSVPAVAGRTACRQAHTRLRGAGTRGRDHVCIVRSRILLQLAAHCVIECNTRLAALFRRSFGQAHVHGADKNDDKNWLAQLPPVDLQVAIGSLPQFLRRTRAEFPARRGYLAADARRGEFWRKQLAAGPRLRVGIAWRGGTLRSRKFARSIDLPQWLPVLKSVGAAFYALQYGEIAAEVESMRIESGASVTNLGAAVDDIDELAAIISALDLVISVDNAVAHLAGALGKPVWTLLPCSPEWRYPRHGEVMPWYPSMRLFRRARGDSWGPVIERVAAELVDVARVK